MRESWNDDRRPERLLTFGSFGWVVLLTLGVAVVIIVMTVLPALERNRNRPPGDGRDPATFGFDLSTSLVPPDAIVAAQLHRDLMTPLVSPAVMAADDVEPFNKEHRGKYVVPSDRVIGVSIGGESRAYPIMIVQLHEVVNDTLGGVPIAVTYSPLCASVVVFDRRSITSDADGSDARELGVSGLLYNSNLLLYDRAAPGRESLWSQLQARALTGPAAADGRRLRMLPVELTHWEDWWRRHPDTTVLAPDVAQLKRYQETNFGQYDISGEIYFPVDAVAPTDRIGAKTRCIVVDAGGERRLYPFPVVAMHAATDGGDTWTTEQGGVPLTFRHAQDPDVVTVSSPAGPVTAFYGFWFACFAMDPGVSVAG